MENLRKESLFFILEIYATLLEQQELRRIKKEFDDYANEVVYFRDGSEWQRKASREMKLLDHERNIILNRILERKNAEERQWSSSMELNFETVQTVEEIEQTDSEAIEETRKREPDI